MAVKRLNVPLNAAQATQTEIQIASLTENRHPNLVKVYFIINKRVYHANFGSIMDAASLP